MSEITGMNKVATMNHMNWSEININNSWVSTLYELYDNRLLFVTNTRYANGSKVDDKQTYTVSEDDYNELIEYLDKINDSVLDMLGCDGDAWEVEIYKDNQVDKHIKAGYMYINELFKTEIIKLIKKYDNIGL